MKVLFDTNVILDVLLDREPHVSASAQTLALADGGVVAGLIGATTVTTIHYLASRSLDRRRAGGMIGELLEFLDVAPVDGPVLREALETGMPDFEDAVLAVAARNAGALAIVTRDLKGFRGCGLSVLEPRELLDAIESLGGKGI